MTTKETDTSPTRPCFCATKSRMASNQDMWKNSGLVPWFCETSVSSLSTTWLKPREGFVLAPSLASCIVTQAALPFTQTKTSCLHETNPLHCFLLSLPCSALCLKLQTVPLLIHYTPPLPHATPPLSSVPYSILTRTCPPPPLRRQQNRNWLVARLKNRRLVVIATPTMSCCLV